MESFDTSATETTPESNIIKFLKKPSVVTRVIAILFSIIVFGAISSEGWSYDVNKKLEICIINGSYSTCQLGTTVAVLAFILAVCILLGEYFYEQLPTTDNRKLFLIGDLIFSGIFAFLFLVAFSSLAHQWSQSKEPRGHYGHSNVGAAIAFSFFSIFVWGFCALIAFRRFQIGPDSGLEESLLGGSSYAEFGSLPGSNGIGGGYQDIGGYNSEPGQQYRPQEIQSPFSKPSEDPGYQQMKY